MNDLIYYPTLDVFVYQLRDGLGDSEAQVAENHDKFWNNLPPKLHVYLEEELAAENPEYIKLLDLLDPKYRKPFNIKDNHLIFQDKVADYQIGGYYYPVRLSDTYGLLFDCSVDDFDHPHSVTFFQKLKEKASAKNGNLGKTWMLSGCLPANFQANLEDLAKASANALIPGDWQELKIGNFLGATVFEVWKSPQKWENVAEENTHILIFFYPALNIMEEAAGFYGDWLRLLCVRNKILWEYAYAEKTTRSLQAEYKSITENVAKVKSLYTEHGEVILSGNKLQYLQKILSESIATLSDYLRKISDLEIISLAIETNLSNYQKYHQQIVQKAEQKQQEYGNLGDTDLGFLKNFSDIVEEKYKAQVAQDRASLSVGLRILEDLINTVRGIIEIEQTKSDRTLDNTIALAGIGLAISGITATAISTQQPPVASYKDFSFVGSPTFVWSIVFSSPFLIILILRLLRR
ncbi:hypothetical protein DP113_27455 [Brasilonema octagenarum UFV-E1]|uniref:CorA-like Mg2+ transporter protein n=1 Tax=Brasilonema sennae CENA114 TaxID=415709 RepID=A0A856MIQ6_9CYAN|nr:hypothetical protein [Brasilonema sennae]QDL11143.1 hypothetical protein DP114_27525 [Brasilonema sennae CENA114]QDL17489.1 hypothetical protein DP113_27455 [Brasilonema octagenarum UFV-E1]